MLIAALVAVVGIVAVSNVGTQAADKLNTVSNLLEESGTGVEPANWDYTNYLCFTANTPGSTVAMEAVGSAPEITLEYSLDKVNWEPFVVGSTTVILEDIGDIVFIRGIDNNTMAKASGNTISIDTVNEYTNYNKFVMSGSLSAAGNIMTLLDYNPIPTSLYGRDFCFMHLFRETPITSSPELPATELSRFCYWNMFFRCYDITESPALPATEMQERCYAHMFQRCYNLLSAPELPSTSLALKCYHGMFNQCVSLTEAPELPATTLTNGCYQDMFYSCLSLVKAPELPATTLAPQCYRVMFARCASLKKAPELPATTLAEKCYQEMFEGCGELVDAPYLPATTLASQCYQAMFNSCRSLQTIKVGYTGNFSANTAWEWVGYNDSLCRLVNSDIPWTGQLGGVFPTTGTFYYNGTSTTTGTSAIPVGWTIQKF